MQSKTNAIEPTLSVRIIPNASRIPQSKLADAELIFANDGGLLSGLKLVGFAVWEARRGDLHVTFPARPFAVNGERRSYSLLRPVDGQELGASDAIRRVVLQAYAAHAEREASQAPTDGDSSPAGDSEETVV